MVESAATAVAVATGAATYAARAVRVAAQLAALASGTATQLTAAATAEQAAAATALPTAGAEEAKAPTATITTGTLSEPAVAASNTASIPVAVGNYNSAVVSLRRVPSAVSVVATATTRTAPKEGWGAAAVMTDGDGKTGDDGSGDEQGERRRWSGNEREAGGAGKVPERGGGKGGGG